MLMKTSVSPRSAVKLRSDFQNANSNNNIQIHNSSSTILNLSVTC